MELYPAEVLPFPPNIQSFPNPQVATQDRSKRHPISKFSCCLSYRSLTTRLSHFSFLSAKHIMTMMLSWLRPKGFTQFCIWKQNLKFIAITHHCNMLNIYNYLIDNLKVHIVSNLAYLGDRLSSMQLPVTLDTTVLYSILCLVFFSGPVQWHENQYKPETRKWSELWVHNALESFWSLCEIHRRR